MFGSDGGGFIPRAFGWFAEAFAGNYRDYQPVDMAFHDREHTLQGTLCYIRLMRSRREAVADPAIPEDMYRLGLLSILLHDSGYLKRVDDTSGTGAKYTIEHVERSCSFACRLLRDHGFPDADIASVQRMISCTGVQVDVNAIEFQNYLERIVGLSVATSDLLGQMAACDYVERLEDLYEEFNECWEYAGARAESLHFQSAQHLLQRTPDFWEGYVKHKLKLDCAGLYRYLSRPYPDGPNEYLQRIEANIARIREINERGRSVVFSGLQKAGSYGS
jgi:hypothetical protein